MRCNLKHYIIQKRPFCHVRELVFNPSAAGCLTFSFSLLNKKIENNNQIHPVAMYFVVLDDGHDQNIVMTPRNMPLSECCNVFHVVHQDCPWVCTMGIYGRSGCRQGWCRHCGWHPCHGVGYWPVSAGCCHGLGVNGSCGSMTVILYCWASSMLV